MLQAAMDKSVKVGPVSVPAKLKKADNLKDHKLYKIDKPKSKGSRKRSQNTNNQLDEQMTVGSSSIH